LVPKGTKVRVSHAIMGPGVSHPDSCDHHKTTRGPGDAIEKHECNFLINTGASISAIPFFLRPRSSKKIIVWGISDQSIESYFTQPLTCSWGDFHFGHSFLIVPEILTPVPGETFYLNCEVHLFLPPGEYFC
jgi:hypothetical protein